MGIAVVPVWAVMLVALKSPYCDALPSATQRYLVRSLRPGATAAVHQQQSVVKYLS
jgi:hypothetical protein